jgi:hypothetical protein
MLVTIVGPNLADQRKGTFHVHKTGCLDLAKYARRGELEDAFRFDATSRRSIVEFIYEDHMNEHPEWPAWETYDDLYLAPCCKGLPTE